MKVSESTRFGLTEVSRGKSIEYRSPDFRPIRGYIAPQALHAPTARECNAGAFSRAYGACTIVIQCNDTKVNRVCNVILWGETPHTPPLFFNSSKISNSYCTVYILLSL